VIRCEWLPPLEKFKGNKLDSKEVCEYYDFLYKIFQSLFIDNNLVFKDKKVYLRNYNVNIIGEIEEFYHLMQKENQTMGKRYFDDNRCERIRWAPSFLEHYNCKQDKCMQYCHGIRTWEQIHLGRLHTYILFAEEKYWVILENRKDSYLLVSAYCLETDRRVTRAIQDYERHCNRR